MKLIAKYLITITLTLLLHSEVYSQSITWQREYIGPEEIEGSCITQTFDGGYIMAGLMFHGNNYILRTNEFGDTIWTKIYQASFFTKIIQTNDSSFVLIGKSSTDVYAYILKIDKNGILVWEKNYGLNTYGDVMTDINELESKRLLCFGFSRFSFTPSILKYFLLKLDSNGDSLSMIYYDNSGGSGIMDRFKTNKILLSGSTNSLVDTNGTLIRFSLFHFGKGLADTSDNSFFFIKDTVDSNNRRIIKLTKTDTLFNEVWVKSINSPFGGIYGNHIMKSNSGFVICGDVFTTFVRGFLLEVDYEGVILWYKEYSLHPRSSYFMSGNNTTDKGFITVGTILPVMFGNTNMLATKTDSLGNTTTLSIQQISINIPNDYILYQNYPNPFNPVTVISYSVKANSEITLKVFDILGKEVSTLVSEKQEPGTYSVDWNANNFSSGIYFYKMEVSPSNHSGQGFIQTKRMVMIK